MDKIRIMIADDQPLMCDGLKTILENEEDIEIVATVGDGLKAYELGCQLKPDVILMDIRMPVMDGVESVRLIKRQCPEIIVIILTTFDDDEYVLDALSYGANGYLLKSIQTEKLIRCVKDSVAGIFSMNKDIASKLAARLSGVSTVKKENLIEELSERESEIAGLIADSYSNREIAAKLFIAEGTVKNYISTIYEKIGTNDRTKAVKILKELLGR
jgi:Response regulator containing a CheY-like receiver domain and an HTH DNA-binding domain